MGWFGRGPTKEDLQGVVEVKVNGWRFKIRRLNPLLDFSTSNMPQVFGTYQNRRAQKEATVDDAARAIKDMALVIEAAVIEPKLVPIGKGEARGKEEGITADDLIRDQDTGAKLYIEILAHSLNRYRGLRGLFESARIRYTLSMSWRRNTDSVPATLPSSVGASA